MPIRSGPTHAGLPHGTQAHLDQLRRELQALDAQLEQLKPPPPSSSRDSSRAGGGDGGNGAASRQSVGQAVAELAAQQNRGLDAFFGRLCNVARVAQPQAVAAVNAVLVESCNLVGACTYVYTGRTACYCGPVGMAGSKLGADHERPAVLCIPPRSALVVLLF